MKEKIYSISLWIGFCISIAYLLAAFFSGYYIFILPLSLFNDLSLFLISNTLLAIIFGGLIGIIIKHILTKLLK